MKLTMIMITAILSLSSGPALAVKWIQKEVTGNLNAYPGCREKSVSMEKAAGEYWFNKNTRILCHNEGYGWAREKVISKGEIACEECGDEKAGKYQCYSKNVKLICKRLAPGY